MQTPNEITQVLERMLPVGSIVEWAPVDGGKADLSTPANVAAYYGFGTWEAYGSGQMLLGVSSSHAVGSTGGAEKVALEGENNGPHGHMIYTVYNGVDHGAGNERTTINAGWSSVYLESGASLTTEGNGTPHENMPPYITIYRWRRIA